MARCIQSIAVPFDNLIAQICNHPSIPLALLQFHTRLVVVPDVRMALRLIHQQLHASAVKLGEVAKTRDKHPTLGASTSDRREADPTLPPYPSLHSHDGSSLHFKPNLPVFIVCQSYIPPSDCLRNASGGQIRNASPKADWWRSLHSERSGRRQKRRRSRLQRSLEP